MGRALAVTIRSRPPPPDCDSSPYPVFVPESHVDFAMTHGTLIAPGAFSTRDEALRAVNTPPAGTNPDRQRGRYALYRGAGGSFPSASRRRMC
jgi:hypothetical protein